MKNRKMNIREIIEDLRSMDTKLSIKHAGQLSALYSELREISSDPNVYHDPDKRAKYYDKKAFLNYEVIVDWCVIPENEIGESNRARYTKKYESARSMRKR